ncbi:MAG: transcriptional regulator [Mariniphaga sp.]
MNNIIADLNKAFDNRVRLGIMSILMVNDDVDFNALKEMLNLTDGNLASHLKALEGTGYIVMYKEFVGRKPRTSFSATASGKSAFKTHLDALEKLIKGG